MSVEKNQGSPIKDCIGFIRTNKQGFKDWDAPYLQSPEDKPFKIENDRIYKIPPCNDARRLGFVDGGNMPIVNTANFNISLHRVAGSIFERKE